MADETFDDTQRIRFPRTGSSADGNDSSPLTQPVGPPQVRSGQFQVPGYEVFEEIGHGATAVVYRARQISLGRLVALKVLRDGLHASPEQRARFQAEAAAVAMLQHPNIVQIYEVGEVQGRTFLALEHVAGGSLADRLRGTPLPAAQAAQLVLTLAQAVQAAHEQGIVHRDLKPGNILISSELGKKERAQYSVLSTQYSVLVPKITDFGLAKLLGHDSQLTETGEILGTPCYMAPEQALGRHEQVGPAADVYSLGAVLYQLLIGRPPFVAESSVETLWLVCNDEPVPPRRLQPKLPRDLETIALKCLHKDPARRYADGAALAVDLRSYLDGQPIRGRATPVWERVGKWVRRRPAVAALTAVCTLVVVAAFALVLWQWREAEAARGEAQDRANEEFLARGREAEQRFKVEAALERAREDLYVLHLASAERAWLVNDAARAAELLHGCPPEMRGWEWGFLHHTFSGSRLTLAGASGPVQALVWRGDGQRITSLGSDSSLQAWSPADGTRQWRAGAVEERTSFTASPDGQTLFVAGHIGGVIRLDAEGQPRGRFGRAEEWPCALALSADGQLLAGAIRHPDRDETPCPVVVWDVATGQEVHRLAGHKGSVLGVAFSADGRLASAGADRTALIWDLSTEKVMHMLRGHSEPVTFLQFAPRNPAGPQVLATSSLDRTARLWDADAGRELAVCRGHTGQVGAVCFRGDGARLATAGWDMTVRVWDVQGKLLHTHRGHTGWVRAVVFSPDGRSLASGDDRGEVKIWDAEAARGDALDVAADKDWVPSLAFDPTGLKIVATGHRVVKTWDAFDGRKLGQFSASTGDVRTVSVHPQGQLLAVGGEGGAWICQAATGEIVRHLRGHTDDVLAVAWSPDGSTLATSSDDGNVRLWDPNTGDERAIMSHHGAPVPGLAFSPDGTILASASHDGTVCLWNAATGQNIQTLRDIDNNKMQQVAFHPDGLRIVTAACDRARRDLPTRLVIWDRQTGQPLVRFPHVNLVVWSVAFSPDGHRLVSAAEEGKVIVWDVKRGRELLSLKGHTDDVRCVQFSPDGRFLATSDDGGLVKVRPSSPFRPAKPLQPLQTD